MAKVSGHLGSPWFSLGRAKETTIMSDKQMFPFFRWSWPQPRVTWTGTCTSTWRCAAWRGVWTCRWRPAVAWSKAAGALRLSALWPAATQGTQTRSRMRCRRRTPKQKSLLADAPSRLFAEIAGSHACRKLARCGPVWTSEVLIVADPGMVLVYYFCHGESGGGRLFWEHLDCAVFLAVALLDPCPVLHKFQENWLIL